MNTTKQCRISATPSMQVDPRLPDNSELRKVARDALSATKYAFAVAVAGGGTRAHAGTFEAALAGALAIMKADRRKNYRECAQRLLAMPAAHRRQVFGRYGALDAASVRRAGLRGLYRKLGPIELDRKLLGLPEKSKGSSAIDIDRLERVWGPISSPPGSRLDPDDVLQPRISPPEPPDATVPFPGYHRKLDFKCRWLKCNDETNPEWLGSDEIAIGGVSVHTKGETKKFGPNTYTGFDDGDREWFSPHWTMASFERPKPKSGEWLYDTYGVLIALAEVDAGGFGKALSEIYGETKKYVMAAIVAGVLIGATPFVGPYIAGILGGIAAWVANELIEWVIGLFGDDVFPTKYATITMPRGLVLYTPDNWSPDGNGVKSNEHDLHFYGHGGHYSVRYYWRFSEWVNGTAAQ